MQGRPECHEPWDGQGSYKTSYRRAIPETSGKSLCNHPWQHEPVFGDKMPLREMGETLLHGCLAARGGRGAGGRMH